MIRNPISSIILANAKREKKLSKFACKSSSGLRKDPDRERIPDRQNVRPMFFHDADKIMHSMSYTRYIDKTQAFYLFENDHITHRALHVQLVSKIARVIGRCLQLNEDLIEAIALGHDIGHVPFGHDGERFLDSICQKNKVGFFCHNAQSIKFLSEIENNGKGLNLTLQVLDGILSHNGEMLSKEYKPKPGKTWAEFEKEYESCFTIKDYSKKIIPMTLEGCVVRVSDVIAYIGRDIEDAITLKIMKRKDIPQSISNRLGKSNDTIINALVMDLLKNSFGREHISFSKQIFKALDDLKSFNYRNIYFRPDVRSENSKIENMFSLLFNRLLQDLNADVAESPINADFLRTLGSDYKKKNSPVRIVVDFISGMTDDFFNDTYYDFFVPRSLGYHL